jgi:hypothetical protein
MHPIHSCTLCLVVYPPMCCCGGSRFAVPVPAALRPPVPVLPVPAPVLLVPYVCFPTVPAVQADVGADPAPAARGCQLREQGSGGPRGCGTAQATSGGDRRWQGWVGAGQIRWVMGVCQCSGETQQSWLHVFAMPGDISIVCEVDSLCLTIPVLPLILAPHSTSSCWSPGSSAYGQQKLSYQSPL